MLEAEGITKRYRTAQGWVVALENVSFALAPGKRIGLVGPSGSGKSTLARILALLQQPDAGAVLVDRVPVRAWGMAAPRHLRRQVQLVWQSPRLATDPRFRIREIILEPLAANNQLPATKAERTALLEYWADRVGLTPELLDRNPHEVSDGQLQRACLARALVLRPRYLICDELSSMLDVSTQASLLEAIALEERERELGVVLITHDRVLAHHWCDDVVELSTNMEYRGAETSRLVVAESRQEEAI
jgi:peptide/nickel transport system ATP-binding protein